MERLSIAFPLYKAEDREWFELLSSNPKFRIKGNEEEKGYFLSALLASQRLRDWREFLREVVEGIKKGVVDAKAIREVFERDYREGMEGWETFEEDKEIAKLCDEVVKKSLNSSRAEEFVVMFMLTQLAHGWRLPLKFALVKALESSEGWDEECIKFFKEFLRLCGMRVWK